MKFYYKKLQFNYNSNVNKYINLFVLLTRLIIHIRECSHNVFLGTNYHKTDCESMQNHNNKGKSRMRRKTRDRKKIKRNKTK
jgi:hypothetical protein